MAMTPEGKVKLKIKTLLAKYNVYAVMPIGSAYGNSGIPDFLCCVRGTFVAVEAKAGKGVATALQHRHLTRIQEQGGHALIINENNLHELTELLETLCAKQ